MAKIFYGGRFAKRRDALDPVIRKKILKAVLLFEKNPFHPSLRLHQLKGKFKGYWSISIDMRYRIIFRFVENGDALFISVGTHAIYND